MNAAEEVARLRVNLEGERERVQAIITDLARREAEVERLREALSFYADGRNYPEVVQIDHGDQARGVLNAR